MSNILHANGILHFQLPKSLFSKSGVFNRGRLNFPALAVYTYLCYKAQEGTKVQMLLTANELGDALKMDADTVQIARGRLEQEGLVSVMRTPLGYTYQLLDHSTGKALVRGIKGDIAPINLDDVSPTGLKTYFRHHTEGPFKSKTGSLTVYCPVHNDSRPSLTVDLNDHGTWKCHACDRGGKLIAFEQWVAKSKGEDLSTKDALPRLIGVLISLGLLKGHLGQPEASYQYRNTAGILKFEVLRYKTNEGKLFLQRRPDPNNPKKWIWNLDGVTKMLYGLGDVDEADVVVICEGEKDCDNVRSLRLTSEITSLKDVAVVTCPGGAHKWQASYSHSLQGKRVIILPDNDKDKTGVTHAQKVVASLKDQALEVRVCCIPSEFKDVSEFLEIHGSDLTQILGSDWIHKPLQP
ncbi:CHC2 zinc finger domain-containing protein [Granulicella tundricola]|uniref:Zinc finger CHC2-type domain-containing protein n=1 Tax=Granulicella tundricola (strain ATCC BAA-1859 / DSM 23138 / MP5ACTX9) TaxID=1198114 RepID=E8X1B6_GRATM|nr:CHC2 zinc finger domain-containing protein [Granulicella tundricola]ADW69070.1 hypothetical protein AciX9_2025 [Granulicella tundricola MP5ACTX9]